MSHAPIPPGTLTPERFIVDSLGDPLFDNPIRLGALCPALCRYTPDTLRVRYDVTVGGAADAEPLLAFEKAGIRPRIFFNPAEVHAAIVTCGGLSPGLNDVIRTIVTELWFQYGVSRIAGVPYGYQGLNPAYGWPMQNLTPDRVSDIHLEAGTILGSSREKQPPAVMADTLAREGINILFCIGGDGTHRGAYELYQEIARRGLRIGIVGIPKTIDNDIAFVYKTFGFDTAVSIAHGALAAAHTEAKSYPRGVGLVKLMGRDSGFVAAFATLASGDVNFALIPEVPFRVEGPNGLLAHLERRLAHRNHALIAVAEGAGRDLLPPPASDIGLFLRDRIVEHFRDQNRPVSMKYIDPSYLLRGTPANAADSIFCQDLGRMAVHAAMAGKTNVMVGLWHNVFVHVPIPLAISYRKKILPSSSLWLAVLEVTGQPPNMI